MNGLIKIKIPYNPNEITKEVIEAYLPSIMSQHYSNVEKIKNSMKMYVGEQEILDKKRPYLDDSANNNKVVENHAKAQVDFKTGYLVGNPKEFAQKETMATNDIKILQNYLADIGYASKESRKIKTAYKAGTSFVRLRPRIEDGLDYSKDSPFKYTILDPEKTFVVYSSGEDEEPVMAGHVIKKLNIDKDTNSLVENSVNYLLHLETIDKIYEIESTSTSFKLDVRTIKDPVKTNLNGITIIECPLNEERYGLMETGKSLYNFINLLSSVSMDNIVDAANPILVFKNVEITAVDLIDMKKAGAIVLSNNGSVDEEVQDIQTVTLTIDYDKLDTLYQSRLATSYMLAGVPLANSSSTSGGDTGKARELGAGWTDAFTKIQVDIASFMESDLTILKAMLKIIKAIPAASKEINELHSSDITIKYNINMSDNLLVKAQALSELLNNGIPANTALNWVQITSDSAAVAKTREDYIKSGEYAEFISAKKGVDNNGEVQEENSETGSEKIDKNAEVSEKTEKNAKMSEKTKKTQED